MKFYDKYGDLHYTMLGALSANLFGKSKISIKAKNVEEIEEDKPIEVMYQSNEISDMEVTGIIRSMMDKLDEPLDAFVKGELNSHIGMTKMINAITGVLAAEIRDKPRVFEYNA